MYQQHGHKPFHVIHTNGPWDLSVIQGGDTDFYKLKLFVGKHLSPTYPGAPPWAEADSPLRASPTSHTHRPLSSACCPAFSIWKLQDQAEVYNQVSHGGAGQTVQWGQSQRERTGGDSHLLHHSQSVRSSFIPCRPSMCLCCEGRIAVPMHRSS